jgi:predicted dehydrogenase
VTGVHRDMGESHVFEDIMQLVDYVREDVPPYGTAEHAAHVIEIIEAAYRASETGQTQELKTTFEPVAV